MKLNKTIFTDGDKNIQVECTTFGAYKFTKLAIELESASETFGAFKCWN